MLAIQIPPAHLSESDPSYALIARILKEDRAATPDADLTALMRAFEGPDATGETEVVVRIVRNRSGGAGFAFDRDSLKITSTPKDRTALAQMHVGDIIVAVNGERVSNTTEYNRVARGVQQFRLTLRRPAADMPQARVRAAVPRPPRRKLAAVAAERRAMEMDIDDMSYDDLLALDDLHAPSVSPGLSEIAINSLELEHVCGGGDECGICLEDFCDGEEVMRLPCLHTFHACCSRDWLRRQARCPFCNFELK